MTYPDTMPNHSVEANRRPAAPPEAGSQFGSSFSARPSFPAALAHLLRSLHGISDAANPRPKGGVDRLARWGETTGA